MTLLSACIICRDEEAVLERCLASLVGVVDEICFVDTGSVDGSIAIAEKYGAQVSHFTWVDDFSAARNESIKRATGRWCLIIDCDEHLEGELAEPGKLKAALSKLESEDEVRAVWPVLFGKVSVVDKDLDETGPTAVTRQIRLFPRVPDAIYYESPIHNRLMLRPDLKATPGFTLNLVTEELCVVHRGYDSRVLKAKKKRERALRILEKAIAEKPDGLNYLYLGREQFHGAEWDLAAFTLRRAKDLLREAADPLEQHHLQSIYFYLVQAMQQAGAPLEATRAELVDALKLFPKNPDLWHEAGLVFLANRELESARDAFRCAIDVLPFAEELESSFLVHRAWVAHLNLAQVEGLRGDLTAAQAALEEAIRNGLPESDHARDVLESMQPLDIGVVRGGVATIPARVDHLEMMVTSIIEQVDELVVYLNGFWKTPEFLIHPKITVVCSQDTLGDLRDSGKFYGAGPALRPADWDYFFALDDDIVYPPNYVRRLVDKVESYHREAVVGVHGSHLLPRVGSYIRDRIVRHCLSALEQDTAVDVIGTGTLAFHRSTLAVPLEAFQVHGMADIWFSLLAQKAGVPRIAIERRAGWLSVLDVETGTLYEEAARDDSAQTLAAQALISPQPVRQDMG